MNKQGTTGRRIGTASLFALSLMLAGCGGGGSGVSSTPTPTPSPTPTPAPTPTPSAPVVNYNTDEYRRSTGPSYHNAIAAYQAGASGAGITIGVIDSGLSDVTGELAGRISPASRDFVGAGTYADEGGHGTAVAQVIGAARNDSQIMGMAWGATILALRTDTPGSCGGEGCSHSTTAIANAIDHARLNGAKIINMSLGGTAAPNTLLQAVSRATAAGIIIIVSAGNDKAAAPDVFASSMTDASVGRGLVIIATSVNADGTHSGFANGAAGYESVTLSAVGDRVLTIDNKGVPTYYLGTSMSAPEIAGAVALLEQAFPSLTPAQVVDLLKTTARDAGATGPDAVFGMGIMDLARAFQPAGATALAGSGVPVTASEGTSLSTAMGDAAAGQSMATVMLDGYGRAFGLDLAAGIGRHAALPALAPGLDTRRRTISAQRGALRMAVSIAPGRHGATTDMLTLSEGDAARARLLSSRIIATLSPRTRLALSFGESGSAQGVDPADAPLPFLVARGAARDLGPEFVAGTRAEIAHALTPALMLVTDMSAGTLRRWAARDHLPGDPDRKSASYMSSSIGLVTVTGPLSMRMTGEMVDERGSTLGARFAPALGAQSARSLFADANLAIEALPGITFSASWRRGWTHARAGGALQAGGMLASESWSGDLSFADIFGRGDMAGLRFSSPLRVIRSRFDLTLPVSYDWQSGDAVMGTRSLNLTPSGRERDAELLYGRALLGGWADAHLYLRRQPAHIATAPDDLGAALRWSKGF